MNFHSLFSISDETKKNIVPFYLFCLIFALLVNFYIMFIFSIKTKEVDKCFYYIDNDEKLINSYDDIKDKINKYNTNLSKCLEEKKILIQKYNNDEDERNINFDNTIIAMYIILALLFVPIIIYFIFQLIYHFIYHKWY